MVDPEVQAAAMPAPGEDRHLGRRLVFALIALVLVVLTWWVGGAVLPRWWAQRISNVIDGRLVFGNLFGFGVGAIFTALPLFVLWLGWKFRRGWRRFLFFILGALVLAIPNLLTLGIVVGSGNAAHAGERILDVDGPGFRGGSTVGAVFAVIAAGVMMWLIGSRGRNKRRAQALKDELALRKD